MTRSEVQVLPRPPFNLMDQILNLEPNAVADAVYHVVLYSGLLCSALPVFYVLTWKFLGFWRKHRVLFYIFALSLFGGTFALFYLNRNDWLLFYEAFPQFVQITGLVLYSLSFILIRISHHHLDLKTILFYSALKQKHGDLVTGGIYKVVRHPVYALIPLFIAGSFMYTGEFILIIPFAVNVLLRWYYARLEEKYLIGAYGQSYSAYKAATPRKFYPVPVRAKSK